ncbi:MAG: hypothetical protein IJ863_00345 [Spirochaetales bacterium]|nr:hypothetical protein [Spirochaetales bacterium]
MEVIGTLTFYAVVFIVFIAFMGVVVCAVMAFMASRQIKRDAEETRRRILSVLPGEDCGMCGFGCCKGYAVSAVKGTEDFRQCPKVSEGLNRRLSLMWIRPKVHGADET